MIIGQHVFESLREIFALSEDQKTTIVLGGLFILMLVGSLLLSFMIESVITTYNLTWRKVARPFAFWALLLIALIESIQLARKKQGFKENFRTRIAEVNAIAFSRNKQD